MRPGYYREENGDYLYVWGEPYSVGHDRAGVLYQREARASAIAGLVSSVCTTGVSLEFLATCVRVLRREVPTEWYRAIHGK